MYLDILGRKTIDVTAVLCTTLAVGVNFTVIILLKSCLLFTVETSWMVFSYFC